MSVQRFAIYGLIIVLFFLGLVVYAVKCEPWPDPSPGPAVVAYDNADEPTPESTVNEELPPTGGME